MTSGQDMAGAALLRFYLEAGIDTAETTERGGLWAWDPAPVVPPKPEAAPAPSKPKSLLQPGQLSLDEAIAAAEDAAARASSLDELTETIRQFPHCPLSQGARGAVIYDGVLGAEVLVMGEAPGRDEDRLGKPFVGRSGQLLDRMLAAIGLSREPAEDQQPVAISNAVFWRPPSNRNPSKGEIAICLPFMRRFITLSAPKLLILTGNVPTQALFPDAPGITRSRGQFRELDLGHGAPIPALPIFHPAFLLRQPAQKRWAWKDLLQAQSKLNETLP